MNCQCGPGWRGVTIHGDPVCISCRLMARRDEARAAGDHERWRSVQRTIVNACYTSARLELEAQR